MHRPSPSFYPNDRVKLIILTLLVLFIFFGGVSVGFGFSHGHVHSASFPGGLPIALKRGGMRLAPPSVLRGDGACCEDLTKVSCAACKEKLSEREFCYRAGDTFATACEDLLPQHSHQDKFSGTVGGVEFSLPRISLDFKKLTLSAWIKLERLSTPADEQINTILANRFSGCKAGNEQRGFAFFVNQWNTADLTLNLQWYEMNNACATIKTDPNTLSYGRWHHVAATLDTDEQGNTNAKLYVDGALKASSFSEGQRVLSIPSETAAINVGRFVIGAHPGNEPHPFRGQISHVLVASAVVPALAVRFPSNDVSQEEIIDPVNAVQAYWTLIAGSLVKDKSPHDNTLKKSAQITAEERQQINSDVPFLTPLGPIAEVIAGTWPSFTFFLNADLKAKSEALALERRGFVKKMMQHAYGAYEQRAFGMDEVTPRSGQGRNNWGGMATTMVDSLDTLWIMDMKDEFWRARDYCRDYLKYAGIGSVSVFETTIRSLGGLMSAYELSGDSVFLQRAKELGTRLLAAFNTPSGLPLPSVSLSSGQGGSGGNVVIAEVGTLQLEFRSLAHHSGDANFAKKVENVHQKMRQEPPANGLWPIYVNTQSGLSAGGPVTFGALGDSFFEYLLKVWIQGGKTEPQYMAEWEAAMDGVHKLIVQRTQKNGLVYLADLNPGGYLNHKMDHLACFMGGALALGAYKRGNSPENEPKNERDMTIAKALTYTCVQMYERQATGIAPEYVDFNNNGQDFSVPNQAPFYILRPETLESLFILHRLTGHPVYRDWGHRIMMSIEKHCRLQYGYGALPDVRQPDRAPDDRMESFFFAETLKYAYLLQSNDQNTVINLDDYVFNTEAHPLKVLPSGWRARLGLE